MVLFSSNVVADTPLVMLLVVLLLTVVSFGLGLGTAFVKGTFPSKPFRGALDTTVCVCSYCLCVADFSRSSVAMSACCCSFIFCVCSL